MKVTRLLLITLLLVTAGPAMAQSRKYNEKCMRKHPAFTAFDCQRIQQHEVWVGMTADMATASLGAPVAVNSTQTAGRAVMQLVYERGGHLGQMREGATGILAPRVYLYIDSVDCNSKGTPGECKVSSIQESN